MFTKVFYSFKRQYIDFIKDFFNRTEMIKMSDSEKIQVVEYEEKYAKEISEIVLNNMYTVNIKDYGKELIDKIAIHFTEDEIKKNFPNRVKCYVALRDGKVVGTASVDKLRDMNGVKVEAHEKKYIILTVFVNLENHHQGIGKLLIQKIEEYASQIGAHELVIPSSIYGCEFYRKLGYDYCNGTKELTKDGQYILSKNIIKEKRI